MCEAVYARVARAPMVKPAYTSFDFQESTLAPRINFTGLPKGAGKVLPPIPHSCKPAVLTDISLEVILA